MTIAYIEASAQIEIALVVKIENQKPILITRFFNLLREPLNENYTYIYLFFFLLFVIPPNSKPLSLYQISFHTVIPNNVTPSPLPPAISPLLHHHFPSPLVVPLLSRIFQPISNQSTNRLMDYSHVGDEPSPLRQLPLSFSLITPSFYTASNY